MGEGETVGSRLGVAEADVGDGIEMAAGGWNFAVAIEHFEEHFRRSVPLCDEGRILAAELAQLFTGAGSLVYEIGVAAGGLARVVLARVRHRSLRYVGIDRVPGMTARAARSLAGDPRFAAHTADACEVTYEPCNLALSYYTLQFVAPDRRGALVRRLCEALVPGGALILFEKVRDDDPGIEAAVSRLYSEYKLSQGYSAAQIQAKELSLDGVLVPHTPAENRTMLRAAGFGRIVGVYRFLCFEGLVAVK